MAYRSVFKKELLLLFQTVREAQRDRAKDLAASIAFWAFFSIFPFLIGIVSLAGYSIKSVEIQNRIGEIINYVLPGSASLVSDIIEGVVHHRGAMSWASIFGLLWSASKVFGAITRVINHTLNAKRTFSFVFSKLRSFFMAVAVSILMILSIGTTIIIEIPHDPTILARLGIEMKEVSRFEAWGMSFAMVFLLFALIYRVAPYIKIQWHQVIRGAILATVLFEICKALFIFYLDRMARFKVIYGSLSSIIVLLLWLYVSALILILGAEYNRVSVQTHSNEGENTTGDTE